MSTETLHLACGSSPEYLPHAAASIHSMLAHRGALAAEVHYLHGPATPEADLAALAGMVQQAGARLRTHRIDDERIAALHPVEFAPATIWYRIFLPDLLADVDRVLYVDVDTLAVDDLGPLWATDLEGCLLGGVVNVWEPWNIRYPVGLGLSGPEDYFNSGVLLMDLAGLRAAGATATLAAFARDRTDLAWGDQDALNVLVEGRWRRLHPRWNCMNSVVLLPGAVELLGAEATAQAQANPGIRHYEGPYQNKPWHLLAPPQERARYLAHRRATPWPQLIPEGRTVRNRLRLLRRDGPRALLRP